MTDADSIWDYCENGLDHQLPDNTGPAMLHFAHAVRSIVKDMNRFDKTKFLCVVCVTNWDILLKITLFFLLWI